MSLPRNRITKLPIYMLCFQKKRYPPNPPWINRVFCIIGNHPFWGVFPLLKETIYKVLLVNQILHPPPGYSFAQLTDVHIEPFYNPEFLGRLGVSPRGQNHPVFCEAVQLLVFWEVDVRGLLLTTCLSLQKSCDFLWMISLGWHSGVRVHSWFNHESFPCWNQYSVMRWWTSCFKGLALKCSVDGPKSLQTS